MYYDKYEKKWGAEPDARTRLQAAQFIFNNLIGLPIQRIEAKSLTANTTPQVMVGLLKKSSAMRDAVRRMLEDAEREP